MRAEVVANVRKKLLARHLRPADIDLDAWYNAAWHSLYLVVADGNKEIQNPGGWLVTAMERRAIDEVRRTRPELFAEIAEHTQLADGVVDIDPAETLDDLDRIRRWRSGIRLRLTAREQQVAVLHFIHGLTRIETADAMRLPTRRVDKIFDSITTKSAGLLRAIDDGSWCESERSLMLAFSAGVLDPAGERYAVALQHLQECPGCAALVRRTRNAYLLIPVPAVAGLATAAGGGALGAALGLVEATGTGAGVTAGGAGLFGTMTARTVACISAAVCLTGAGAGVVIEATHQLPRQQPARAARSPPRARGAVASNITVDPRPITTSAPASSATPSTAAPAAGASPRSSDRSPSRNTSAPRRRAAARHDAAPPQEHELGIEPGASPPSTASAPADAASSGGTTSASSASTSTSSSGSSGGSTGSASSGASDSAASSSTSGGGRSSPEIGIEP